VYPEGVAHTTSRTYLENDNDEPLLVVQLETLNALENIDEIVSVEHLDVVFIAVNNLAQAMGLQGQAGHPQVVTAMDCTGKQVPVPRIFDRVCRTGQVEVNTVKLLRRYTDKVIRITLPGTFTMTQQTQNDYYADDASLAQDYAMSGKQAP